MNTQHLPAIIIGAGQAGLAMSYCLQQQNIDHVILEKTGEIASSWRHQRWDNFCLVTPNWQCQLPGFYYQGDDPDGFMVKKEIIHYLENYQHHFKPQIVFNSEVLKLSKNGNGFRLETAQQIYTADQVVIACGSYHTPKILPSAQAMPPHIQHIHSSQYKNADQLPPGDVMVVGTGQSGSQIAEDLMLAGRQVHLCVSSAPRVNRRYRGKDVVNWLDEMGYYQTSVLDHPEGKQAAHATNHYVTGRDGGRDINLRIFAQQGMKLYGRLLNATLDNLHFADDLHQNLDNADEVAKRITDFIEDYIQANNISAPADDNIHSDYQPPIVNSLDFASHNITAVIWATGFNTQFKWLELPVLNERDYPIQARGVSPVKGIYFLGLNWMNTWGSGRFYHVGRDAEYLANQLVQHHLTIHSACA